MATTLQDAEDMLMAYSCLSIGTNPFNQNFDDKNCILEYLGFDYFKGHIRAITEKLAIRTGDDRQELAYLIAKNTIYEAKVFDGEQFFVYARFGIKDNQLVGEVYSTNDNEPISASYINCDDPSCYIEQYSNMGIYTFDEHLFSALPLCDFVETSYERFMCNRERMSLEELKEELEPLKNLFCDKKFMMYHNIMYDKEAKMMRGHFVVADKKGGTFIFNAHIFDDEDERLQYKNLASQNA